MMRKALWIFLAALVIFLTVGAILLLAMRPALPPAGFLAYTCIFIAGFLAASVRIAEHLTKGEDDHGKGL